MQWLLAQGAPANAPNNAARTALHSAVCNKQQRPAQLLVCQGHADVHQADDDEQSPLQAAAEHMGPDSALVRDLALCAAAVQLQQHARNNSGRRSAAQMRTLLLAAGRLSNGCTERHELEAECRAVLQQLPELREPVVVPSSAVHALRQHWHPGQSSADAAPACKRSAESTHITRTDSPEGRAAAAQATGNECFKAGDYQRAALRYSLALRLFERAAPQRAALLSNRSAAHAKLGRWEQALEDAESAVKLDSMNAKFWCRKGAALVGLGQAGEAVKMYKHAQQVDPSYASAQEGLLAAREAIKAAEQCYRDMHGSAPS